MPDGRGYFKFDAFPVLDTGGVLIKFGDHTLEGRIRKIAEPITPAGIVLRTHGGTSILQLRYVGSDRPYTLAPVAFPLEVFLRFENDAVELVMHSRLGLPFALLMAWPFMDAWSIKAAPASQTNWRTSRRLSYGVAGITHTTHPPRAWIDGTEQTIVTAAPSAGEVQVPTSQTGGQNYEEIVTPSGLSGDTLKFLYWPEWVARFAAAGTSIQVANGWIFSGTVQDLPSGVYT